MTRRTLVNSTALLMVATLGIAQQGCITTDTASHPCAIDKYNGAARSATTDGDRIKAYAFQALSGLVQGKDFLGTPQASSESKLLDAARKRGAHVQLTSRGQLEVEGPTSWFKSVYSGKRLIPDLRHDIALARLNGGGYFNGVEFWGFENPNPTEAAKNFRDLAEEDGYTPSMYALGLLYTVGEGVEQSYSEAGKWFLRAALKDHAEAQYAIALLFEEGKGVEQSQERRIEWLKAAAKNGQAGAREILYKAGHYIP